MKEKLKIIVQNPWIISIGSSVTATLLASAILSISSENTFPISIGIVLTKLLKFFLIVLTFKIPVWIILLGAAVLIFILLVWSKTSSSITPNWLKYTYDYYKNWNIEWKYVKNYEGKYKITNLRTLCNCKCELSERTNRRSGQRELFCPSCGKIFKMFYKEDQDDAKKVIIHKINTSQY